MIIPSIDLMGGQTVQLVGGKDKALDAGDPRPILENFRRVGEVAVVDLDAALGKGSNADLIQDLVKMGPCRVGGGIRDVNTAMAWLDRGATKVVLGTAAKPEILRELPKERVIAALDARHGEVVVEGWQTGTGRTITDRMTELRDYVGGFLVTFVEREGRLQGIDLARVKELVDAAGGVDLTVAGGVTTPEDVAEIDRMGAHAQVGMALYTGKFDLASALGAMLSSDRPDGLWPTVVVDELGVALGLAYSNEASLRESLVTGKGTYHSRKRGLWRKGETSGADQIVRRVDLDCDRDTLRFVVEQRGPGFCHKETATCWGRHEGLAALEEVIVRRGGGGSTDSYTKRLFDDPGLLRKKLLEEAQELADAKSKGEIVHELADLLYFALVSGRQAGVGLADVARALDERALRVTRRGGDAK